MRVRINNSASYRGKYNGCCGTIKNPKYDTVGILLDDHYNDSSSKGLFWFKPGEFDEIHSYPTTMMPVVRLAMDADIDWVTYNAETEIRNFLNADPIASQIDEPNDIRRCAASPHTKLRIANTESTLNSRLESINRRYRELNAILEVPGIDILSILTAAKILDGPTIALASERVTW